MTSRDYHEQLWASVPLDAPPYDFARRRRFLLEHVSTGRRVLDAGCGDGAFTAELERAGAQVVAIDVAQEPLRRTRARATGARLALVAPDEPWPLPDNAFEVVWAGEVIEHVADTALWLSEVRRVLAPGGLALVTTPDHGPLTLARLAVSRHARAATLDPLSDHLRFYTRATLATLLAQFGFDEVRIRATGGVPGARRTLLASARRAGLAITRTTAGSR